MNTIILPRSDWNILLHVLENVESDIARRLEESINIQLDKQEY
jgi:hypothetical protein